MKAVFASVFRKYCTYCGKNKIQFENNRFETSDQATIEFLKTCGDKNITMIGCSESAAPVQAKPVEPAPAPVSAPAKQKTEKTEK